jgi:hypothetical protein
LDIDGNQIFDTNGDPIPIMVPVQTNGSSIRAGAANNSGFLAKFDQGGSHAGQLTPAELKLLSEWIDIGAQYYNNPFDAPVN